MSGPQPGARVSLARAKEIVVEAAVLTGCERLAVEAAVGRVTAEPVYARLASPCHRVAAMDGIAVRAADTHRAEQGRAVVFAIAAGEAPPAAPPASVPAPVCAPVDTGNALPDWADAVVRIEEARRTQTGYEVRAPVTPGRDVRAPGEDVAAGALVLGRGRTIGPVELGAMLATGVAHVSVRCPPRIGVLATGSEVIEPPADGEVPAPGQVIEFNGRVLAAYARGWGAEVDVLGRAPDDEAALAAVVRRELAARDTLCVIAGSSAGRKDFTIRALRACGEILFHGVEVMPGRPAAFARVDGKNVVAVPGYPVSAVVAVRELLRPLVDAALGRAPARRATVRAVVRRNVASRLGVEEIVRVCLVAEGNAFVAVPLARGAGSISSLLRAHGLLRIGPTTEGVAGGTAVDIELLDCDLDLLQAVVVAGPPDAVTAALEDAVALAGVPVRMSHLGLAPHDAAAALAAGEAHVAVLDADASAAVPAAVVCPLAFTGSAHAERIALSATFAATATGTRIREALAGEPFRRALGRLANVD